MSLPLAHEAALRKWITSRGGAVHDALALSDDAPCGARGVVAVRPVGVDELMQNPLVCIPKTLHLDNRMATAKLQAATPGQAATHEVMKQMEAIQMVAAALALERSLGMASEWCVACMYARVLSYSGSPGHTLEARRAEYLGTYE
eukprot:358132-Chlamydomonas_euryale.AAC.6